MRPATRDWRKRWPFAKPTETWQRVVGTIVGLVAAPLSAPITVLILGGLLLLYAMAALIAVVKMLIELGSGLGEAQVDVGRTARQEGQTHPNS